MQIVPVADVTKFMRDDGFQLRRRQSLEDAFGQQQDRPENAEDTRLQESREDNRAGSVIPSCTGDPARTAARMRRQRIHHEQAMPRNPHAQMPNRIAGSGTVGEAAACHQQRR